jgi:hypothetical protein
MDPEQPASGVASGPGLAPIAFFAYRRPWTTLQALYALSRCPEASRSELHVFSDGARNDADRAAIALVREVVRSRPWCGQVELHESAWNLGLARSVIDGIGSLCHSHGRVIALEDDLLVSNGFLAYMNRGLKLYHDQPAVMQISGHSFPAFEPAPRAVLMPLATTWGWATWQRAWSRFEAQPRDVGLLRTNHALRRSFDLDGAYPYSRMLERQVAGEVDSWGIRWWWTVHQNRGLGLFPLRTLVRNIGFDPDATHTRARSALLDAPHWLADAAIREFPQGLQTDQEAFRSWKQCVRALSRTGLADRIGKAARSLLPGRWG